MPYSNIETRRKYQRDAYQKKKLEYSEQRKQANKNINNELYNSLVNERLQEKFKYNNTLKNEIKRELKELKNLDIETYNDPIKRDDRYNKIDTLKLQLKNINSVGIEKEESKKYKYKWVKHQLQELKQMCDFSFSIDNDETKRDERYKKMDDLKNQLKNINDDGRSPNNSVGIERVQEPEEKEESEKYKIGFVEDDGTKELERHLKNNWIKRQLKELTQMANDDFEKDGDLIKLTERFKKMDYLKIQLKETEETTPTLEPYKINNESNESLDFLTFMSKYKPKNKVFYLAPLSSEFLKEFVPDYWTACVKNNLMPLSMFKKCIL